MNGDDMEGPPPARGERLAWGDVPVGVRERVQRWLGGRVVEAVTQPAGFSPGVAARLVVDDGRRVFVKAIGPEPNADSPDIHRSEIRVAAALPSAAPVSRMLWSHDEGAGGWVVLAFEDIDGRHPTEPWQADELDRVVAAMEEMGELLTPSPLPESMVGAASVKFGASLQGWRRLRDDRPSLLEHVDEWSRRHIDTLVAIDETAEDALKGSTLLHSDIRADNILLTPERTWFVDWPHACVGPSWFEVVGLAPSVTMQGGPPPEEVAARHSAYRAADGDAVTAAAVALAGYFTYQAVQPPLPGLPTLRAFQEAQGTVARQWVAQRTGLL